MSKSTNLETFFKELDGFKDVINDMSVANFKRFVFQLAVLIIMRTPVDKGVLSRAWDLSFDEVGGYEPPKNYSKGNAGQTEAVNSIRRKLMGLKKVKQFPKTFFLYNRMPYAIPVEFEGHSSIKAPDGMVRVSIAEIKGVFGI